MVKHCLIFSLLSMLSVATASEKALIGEGNDANRSGPVHRIKLFDDQGEQIKASDEVAKPFSVKQTCGQCHNYETIASGWHFNGHDTAVPAGRPGQPWVLVDSKTRTQIPISGRKWPGTFTPQEIGMSAWEFQKAFYSHFPGGSYGELEPEEPDEMIRKEISGEHEINCLACHHNDPKEDQSLAALQSARQNYRWIPAAASGKTIVKGVASALDDFFDPEYDKGISPTYAPGTFDADDKVFFDVSGKPQNTRCDFCHSDQDLRIDEAHEWQRDEDVHLKSGLNCVDCHPNGDAHMTVRGNDLIGDNKTLSCQGCHEQGRLGAPNPRHAGIPPIHFTKMTCTACHSGTWPTENAGSWKTAMVHKMGLHGKHSLDITQPHVYAPVLMKGADGKIGPHKMIWPAYWAREESESLVPILPKEVLESAGSILQQKVEKVNDWRPLTEEKITAVLKLLGKKSVYISGGVLYRLDEKEQLTHETSDLAKPYAWPIAHDVRPAGQALGVHSCEDCHANDAPFFFGKVAIDSPVIADQNIEMIELQGVDRGYMQKFNDSFTLRPLLKIIVFTGCALVALVLLAFLLRAILIATGTWPKEGK